jgi:hypothetical protein
MPTITKIDAPYQAVQSALKDALLTGDPDKIDQAKEKVSDLEDNLDTTSQADVVLTDTSKNEVSQAAKLITIRQLAGFLGNNADDLPDPTEIALDVLDHSHGTTDDDFADMRDDAADQIGLLAGGVVLENKPRVVVKLLALLNKDRKLSDADFNSQHQALIDEVKKVTQDINPLVAIRHWTEEQLAQLLANPELAVALDEYKPPQDSEK